MSEGFCHYAIRRILDTYKEVWIQDDRFPEEIHQWVWSILVMTEKPLLPDVAADMTELGKLYLSLG